MNSLIAWNLAATEDKNKKTLLRHEFLTIIAHKFMSYVDQTQTTTTEDQGARLGGVDSRITTVGHMVFSPVLTQSHQVLT